MCFKDMNNLTHGYCITQKLRFEGKCEISSVPKIRLRGFRAMDVYLPGCFPVCYKCHTCPMLLPHNQPPATQILLTTYNRSRGSNSE